MSKSKSEISIAFLGNAFHDTRVYNLSNSLIGEGNKVSVFSIITGSIPDLNSNSIEFVKIEKKNPALFYLKLWFRLYKKLLKTNSDIFIAEDVYTLPAVFLAAKQKGRKVYYNSREIFAHLAGIRNKKWLQFIWANIEKLFIASVDVVMVTGEMDAEYMNRYFNLKQVEVIRNLPLLKQVENKINLRARFGISDQETILIYQGVILEGRGLEPVFKALQNVNGFSLVILGDGPFRNHFENMASNLKIDNKVFFAGMIDQNELINYTAAGDIGIALIENISISYYYALPGKLFEYIIAGLPVLCSPLPQMKNIIENYKIGECIDPGNINAITAALNSLKEEGKAKYNKYLKAAADELNWQKEYDKVKNIFQ